jgi:phosphoribosylanthranilate isomerase
MPDRPLAAIKFCGLRRISDIDAAARAQARYVGFVFFEKSPRHVPVDLARDLALHTPPGVAKVGLMVNPSDDDLAHILRHVALDIVQLHGAESPARVAEISAKIRLPVMKAVGIADHNDLGKLPPYEAVADQILVDAKPPKTADLPGGNGVSFDWRLIAGRRWRKPWMLAGGLGPDNVAHAVRLAGARQVDVSSGVETAPGIKDAGLMLDFAKALTPKAATALADGGRAR